MTTRQLLELARVSFKELGDKQLLARLNEAQIEWCDATDYLVTSAAIAAGTSFPANLPTGFARVAEEGVLMFETTGVPSERAAQIYEARIDRDQEKYRLYDKSDRQYIIQVAANFTRSLKFFYIKNPTTLIDTNDGTLDTAPVIPSQYHSALVYRAIEPYFIAAGNLPMGQFCRNAFDEAVQKGKRLARMERSRLIEQFIPEMEM